MDDRVAGTLRKQRFSGTKRLPDHTALLALTPYTSQRGVHSPGAGLSRERRDPIAGVARNDMQPTDLAFYTTKELIAELMRRKTFLGIVVHSEKELKDPNWRGEQIFQVHFNSNLQPEEAGRLLDRIAEHIGRQEY